jgi:hypothetical protein
VLVVDSGIELEQTEDAPNFPAFGLTQLAERAQHLLRDNQDMPPSTHLPPVELSIERFQGVGASGVEVLQALLEVFYQSRCLEHFESKLVRPLL